MADNTIFVQHYTEEEVLPVNFKEVWRYAGYFGDYTRAETELQEHLDKVLADLAGKFSYKICYRRMPLEWNHGVPQLPFANESQKLAATLIGCKEVVLFGATIGLEIDRYIARYQRTSPVKALLAQAYGAERIESLCDTFCDGLDAQVQPMGLTTTRRYSPGYGDLPLATQTELFRLLDCSRQIGLTLNNSLLMTPTKSVTAIFGIGPIENKKPSEHCKCAECEKVNCEFRTI